MITLRIEHAITDLATWRGAFARFSDARRDAGVRTELVQRPVDDPAYITVDLGFDDIPAAEAFRDFLERTVWPNTANSPALLGRPQTRILEDA